MVAINFHSSTVNGGYTEWTLWSSCTKSCDGGSQIRTRNCTLPLPIDGGLDCADLGIGGDEESRQCNTLVCPGEKGVLDQSKSTLNTRKFRSLLSATSLVQWSEHCINIAMA